ncbi:MAG: NAD-dependent dehydratase [Sulfurimonas sp. RIFOXYD12_FULL_33_39]|uniref:SDR family oxidoreductase n=1 Tax=unclassified Sulfurimonas TaxID=2623549 RepID=UPI0008C673C8|nr:MULTISPECIES: SDR family oxidoreductase [unclassified Sulfurimonas]OHE04711.1 MAG: NAD-dependent dehydratase [Sulfurimonas sp. RIFCSPLOWO2_12_FULL_34_6]OHE10309.1 MAG: NAD-dependent dehydratase [Sulfurimonas sp. RIFOXYD12_FULL_33_39]OHE13115.1 MAG: NAD-dependent dehydratase [Sulfurimonas sp. RIFOXYD2_FULL_34_21]DAB28742.1 MAG TPA: NAD-dependent dehydratase [Sulfurimonas sp. UBA10385]
MKKQKAVVTGGAGFIGSHMVDLLVSKNYKVTVIDNLANGRLDNLEHHKGKIEFVQVDIGDYEVDLTPYFEDAHYVFHYAALADIVPSINNPLKYHKANVDGTLQVLEAAKKSKNLKKFIYAASSSCYGIPEIYPTPESSPIKPEYPYAHTKTVGEQYAMHWAKVYDMPVISMRFFNVYGVRHRTSGAYGAVFGVFLAQLLNDKPLTIVGDGKQTRDFTYVTDIVDACYLASQSNFTNEIFNVGSDNTYSINYLVDLLGGDRVYIPKRPGEPDSTYADIRKIKRELGWYPKVSFEEGVKIMLENIELWREAPLWDENSIKEATKDWFECLGDK